jgi:hypothetical protein
LLKVIDTGDMVVSTVASFGPTALPEALKAFQGSSDEAKRQGFVLLFGKMLEPENVGKLKAEDITTIRAALFQTVTDKDYSVRFASVKGLRWLNDPDTKQVLEHVAATDPTIRQAAHDASAENKNRNEKSPND